MRTYSMPFLIALLYNCEIDKNVIQKQLVVDGVVFWVENLWQGRLNRGTMQARHTVAEETP